MMREYSNIISLTKNSRGVSSLDPSIGCASGMAAGVGGCYNDCYAAKSAKLYGYDFSKTVLRCFKDEQHRRDIIREINRVDLDFIRMGTSGDPSEYWNHTIDILKNIDTCNKQVVIITKHWTNLTFEQLGYLGTINVCVNTSVSALDDPVLLENGVQQYKRLKHYCRSVLRIVSADFNLETKRGRELHVIQNELFQNESTLDTVLRVNNRNPMVKFRLLNTRSIKFMGKRALASKFDKKTYMGKCATCKEMCGLRTEIPEKKYPKKRGTHIQQRLL